MTKHDSVNLPATVSWIDVTPFLVAKDKKARAIIRSVTRQLASVGAEPAPSTTVESIRHAGTNAARRCSTRIAVPLIFCVNVLCDFCAQGWTFRTTSRRILAAVPANGGGVDEEKRRVRIAHLVERNAQLRQPSVRRFIREMERRRLHRGAWHSIFSLMRDGRELALRLAAGTDLPAGPARNRVLREAIDPYLQVVKAGARCEFTGLELSDIWRYFRHTWTTTYQSTPGRKVFLLVRDRASANHPIIGIAALGSAIVQLSVRDTWIGWTAKQLVETIRETPSAHWARWLDDSVDHLIRTIFISDFVKERRFRRSDLRKSTMDIIARLRALATTERKVHHLYPARRQHKNVGRARSGVTWATQARSHLFRSKRAIALAELLTARRDLQGAGVKRPSSAAWKSALASASVARAIATILRYTKATHVGVDMMDITVCGAIAPYNSLLGGKLVSLLMASPAVRTEYARRYRTAQSVIASSMAGRPVIRRPQLVLLGTTSLYGVGASQYNRLKMPAELAGGPPGLTVAYEMLGQTAGYGSYHFSQDTMRALELLLGRLQRGRPVNSIFGEGVNPKMRKVRSALDAVGFPSDLLLQHGSPRIVYGICLAENFREVLLGLSRRAKYILPANETTTGRLVDFWCSRWLAKRVERPEVIADVQRHSTVYPVDHGARVALSDSPEELGPLFASHNPSIPPIGRRTDEPIDSGETDAASPPSVALRATTPLGEQPAARLVRP
jgi:Domain of unknown function (DUF4338)